jgi:ATP synthase F1, epsilon subunit
MSDFYLKMISSNGVFYEGLCNSLIIPAPDGERAVMAHHEELMIAVTEGEARFRKKEGEAFTSVVVGRGYCQVANNRVVLLTDTIERPEDIDEKRAREALERANERLRQKQSIREYHMTRAAMARALARIRESEKFAGY